MQITKVRLTRSKVGITYENEKDTFTIDSKDRPLPSFFAAVKALTPIIIEVLNLPESYAGTPHPTDLSQTVNPLRATGLTVATKQGSRLVCFTGSKELPDSHSPFNVSTPLRFMDHPETEGSYSPALSDETAAAVDLVIAEAKRYILKERAQGELPLEEDKPKDNPESEPQGGEVLPME